MVERNPVPEYSPLQAALTERASSAIISPQARLIGAVFNESPVPIPEEYADESKLLVTSVLQTLPSAQKRAVEEMHGFNGDIPTFAAGARKFGISRNSFRKSNLTGIGNIKINLFTKDKATYFHVREFAPIPSGTIARSLFGSLINRDLRELVPFAPFDYSRLSTDAQNDLANFPQTSGYRKMTVAFLVGTENPGLSLNTIEELRKEAAIQLQ